MTQPTETDCHMCGEAKYLRTESDIYCPACHFAPDGENRMTTRTAWEQWFAGREHARRKGQRLWAVGGRPAAYYGEGEYTVNGDEVDL